MLDDEIGDVIITYDGASILKQLKVVHPITKFLVEIFQIKDRKIGDGTASVFILAAELQKLACEPAEDTVQTTSTTTGYLPDHKE